MKKKGMNLRNLNGGAGNLLKKMKLLFAFFFAGLLAVSASTYSQQTKLSMKFDEVTVKEVFKLIEEKSEFVFFYNEDYIDVYRKVSIDVKDEKVESILNDLFRGTKNTFKIYDRQIVILSPEMKELPPIMKSETKTQQQKSISGKVSDSTGSPLPGVSVAIKGTSIGTITDGEGNFSLPNVPENSTLQFSFVGMKTQEIAVGDKTILNVTLEEETVGIEEVVAVGYGTITRKEVTGAIATISKENLTLSPTANASELLGGKVAGILTRQTSSLPGSDNTEIQIRSYGNPLVLVDGIEMSFSRVDPNDIESVSVLKDAAAAIYGARAGNGVILVTTKRGSSKVPKISYHGTFTTQTTMSLTQQIGAGDYAALLREAQLNDGLDPKYSEEEVQNYIDGIPGYGSYDWRDATIKNFAPMQQHNISVSGGSKNVKYFTSIGFLDQESIFRSRDYDYSRYNIRSNIDIRISERIDFSVDLAYQKDLTDRAPTEIWPVWDAIRTAKPVLPTWGPDKTKALYSGFQTRNPMAMTMKSFNGFSENHNEAFTGKVKVSYKIPGFNGLKATAGLNLTNRNGYSKIFSTPRSTYNYDVLLDLYTLNAAAGKNINLTEQDNRSSQIFPFASLNYEGQFKDHKVKGLLHGEYIEDFSNKFWASRENLLAPTIPYLFAGSELNINNNGDASEGARASIVGRINYSYKEKYYATVASRYDANVQFAPDHRWGFFPSVELAWRISEEGFFEGALGIFDDMKIRASYSQTGNDRFDDGFVSGWDYLTGFQIITGTTGHLFGNEVGRQIRTLGISNPNLTWEQMTNYNFGVNTVMFNNKLIIEADVFYRKREGMLAIEQSSLPDIFGGDLPKTNLNSQYTKGIEGMVTWHERIGKFGLDISPNFTWARSKWIHYEEDEYTDEDDIRLYKLSGNWVSRNVGYLSDGLFMTQAEIDSHPIDQDQNGNSTLRPGDIKYIDLNKDGVITSRDQDIIGKGDFPTISFGLNLKVNYKNLSLNAGFQGASGFDRMITAGNAFDNESVPLTYHRDYRWQPDPNNPGENINPNAKYPALSTLAQANNSKESDFWLKDGTYIRLKNLQLAYSLPENLTRKIGSEMIEVYLAGTNVFTLTKLGIYNKSFDPEQSFSGRVYPLHKNYSIGLRITL